MTTTQLRPIVASLLLFFGFRSSAVCQAQVHHVSCAAISADAAAPNAAVDLYWRGEVKDADASFNALLAEHPGDPDLTEGAVRTALALRSDPAAALQLAQAAADAHASSPAANTALGEMLFRTGRINEADKLFAKATQLDPCYAPARLGIAHVALASSMYAAAQASILTAHALNQRDPDITRMWLHTLAPATRIAEIKKILGMKGTDSPRGKQMEQTLAREEQAQQASTQHHCQLVSSVEKTKLPMVPIMRDPTHIDKWGLDTSIQGKTARLAIDSGASGLVVGRAFANRAGLKFEDGMLMGGFGDHGAQKGHLAYATSVQVGGLEFHDCRVAITERREVVGLDGLIGPDVFQQYLVSLNFPDHSVTLESLPARPGKPIEAEALDTGSEDSADAEEAQAGGSENKWQNRYIAPSMQAFTQVFRFGHLLLIPAALNSRPPGLMVLDTGDFSVSISEAAARNVTHARIDNKDQMYGVSGRVEKLAVGGDLKLHFGHAEVPVTDILVMDHSGMSRSIGTEISGFIGFPVMQSLIFQIDYRDGLVNFIYDPKKDANRGNAPGTECSYCNPGYTK